MREHPLRLTDAGDATRSHRHHRVHRRNQRRRHRSLSGRLLRRRLPRGLGRGFTGRDEIARWNQTDNIGKQSHFDLVDIEGDGPDYVVTLKVSGNGYNGTGPMTITVDGDHITRLVISA